MQTEVIELPALSYCVSNENHNRISLLCSAGTPHTSPLNWMVLQMEELSSGAQKIKDDGLCLN